MIFILIISKGHNSAKNVDELLFFFSACHLVKLNICTKFHSKILEGIKLKRGHNFQRKKKSKGHNSVINVGGVIVHFALHICDDGLYLYKVS